MKRWAGIISDSDGLDTFIQLADDPDASMKMKLASENAKERAIVVYVLEEGHIPNKYNRTDIIDQYVREKHRSIVKQAGGADLGQYAGYDLRKRFANGNLLEVSWIASESEMKKIKGQGPYSAAIDILNLVLSGKGSPMRKNVTKDDIQDYIDIMEMKLKKENRRKK